VLAARSLPLFYNRKFRGRCFLSRRFSISGHLARQPDWNVWARPVKRRRAQKCPCDARPRYKKVCGANSRGSHHFAPRTFAPRARPLFTLISAAHSNVHTSIHANFFHSFWPLACCSAHRCMHIWAGATPVCLLYDCVPRDTARSEKSRLFSSWIHWCSATHPLINSVPVCEKKKERATGEVPFHIYMCCRPTIKFMVQVVKKLFAGYCAAWAFSISLYMLFFPSLCCFFLRHCLHNTSWRSI